MEREFPRIDGSDCTDKPHKKKHEVHCVLRASIKLLL